MTRLLLFLLIFLHTLACAYPSTTQAPTMSGEGVSQACLTDTNLPIPSTWNRLPLDGHTSSHGQTCLHYRGASCWAMVCADWSDTCPTWQRQSSGCL